MMICDSFLSMTPYWKECGKRSFNVTGANCSSWWHSKMAVVWGIMLHQIRPAGPLHGTTVTQRQKWGLGQDASCYFHSFEPASASLSISLSFSLLGNGQKKISDSLKLGTYVHFSPFSLAKALVCQKGIQREKKSSAEQVHLFILPGGPNWSSVQQAFPFFCWGYSDFTSHSCMQ